MSDHETDHESDHGPAVAGEPAGARLMRSLDYRLSPPTTAPLAPEQVAVVLHALADHSLLEAAREYSRGYPRGGNDDTRWPTSLSIGRFLHDTADQLTRPEAPG